MAERAMNRKLNGSCSVAIGAYAKKKKNKLSLHAIVSAPDGTEFIRMKGKSKCPNKLGVKVAEKLLASGAQRVLDLADDS